MTKNEYREFCEKVNKRTVWTKIEDFFDEYIGIIAGGFLVICIMCFLAWILISNSNTKEAEYKVHSYETVGDFIVVEYIENKEIKETRFPKKQIKYEESDETSNSPLLTKYRGGKWRLTIYIEKGKEK